MIACQMSYNRAAKSYDVVVTYPTSICGIEKNTYYFDNSCQGIGVLVTRPVCGPENVAKRAALLNALIKAATPHPLRTGEISADAVVVPSGSISIGCAR